MKRTATAICACFLAIAATAQTILPYQNTKLPAGLRADDLISRLTLEEKASLMVHESPAIKRLGIKEFPWWNEALHGVARNELATVFPITMNMAASFDDELLYRVFTAVSDEARAKNQQAKRAGEVKWYQGLSFWTPNINIFRDPRWGRGQETYGEDPYLTSRMGVAVVRGLQGPDDAPYRKTLACAKHFAVHSGPEWNRHSFNLENLPERDLWETYILAFKALVQEAKVEEVMCAYQRIDGQPCCGNSRYLRQILRNELCFNGLVTSDCWAISDFFKPGYHEVVKTEHEAAAMALRAGTDVECGPHFESLPKALANGEITEKEIDESLRKLIIARIKLGDFDPDEMVEWTRIPESVIACKEHSDLALKMAEEGIVLLQNRDNMLPLKKQGQRIFVIGDNANDSTMLWGNYNGFPRHTITILDGIKAKSNNVTYIDGCGLIENRMGASELQRIKDEADVVLFVGGISPRLEGEEMDVTVDGFKGGDRTSIELPHAQRHIIEALYRLGKKVVFVNCSGSAMALVPEAKHCDAIVQAWYGGERGGEALANILFGDVNPSGKLPVTFYRNTEQLPDYMDYTMHGRTYRYMTEEPLFAFGHGLSYTQFKAGNVSYANEAISMQITNTGKRDGDEVVQIYLRRIGDDNGPVKTLRAFRRVSLKAGQTTMLDIPFGCEKFEWWDPQTNTMRPLPGRYELTTMPQTTPQIIEFH